MLTMHKTHLFTYWQYGIYNKAFNDLLQLLNVDNCCYLYEDRSDYREDIGFYPIYLYEGLSYYRSAVITHELDDEILKAMRPYEPVAMDIINRWRRSLTVKDSYLELKEIYIILLRFWNNLIQEHKINLAIITIMPHIPQEYIVYALCKVYSIPVIIQTVIPFSKGEKINYLLKPSIESLDEHFESRYKKLLQENITYDASSNILVPYLARYFEQYDSDNIIRNDKRVVYYNEKNTPIARIDKYIQRAIIYIKRMDYAILMNKIKYLIKIRIETHSILKEIEHLECDAEYTNKYYFFALHLQPEASTLPGSGTVFTNQLLAIRLLSKHLPQDTLLYVKEHPAYWMQKERLESIYESRNIDFYKEICSLRNVKLIKHTIPSQLLISNSIGVVTVTGTVGFEALFVGKPVIIFGTTFYMRHPSVFFIRTNADCKYALHYIANHSFVFDKYELILYLKALEKYVVPLGAREQNFVDNGTPVVSDDDRLFLVNKIFEFYREFYGECSNAMYK